MASSSAVHKVFVYGTLKSGQPNHYLFKKSLNSGAARLLGTATLTKRFPMVLDTLYNIPFLLAKENTGKVGSLKYMYTKNFMIFFQLTAGSRGAI